MAEYTADTLFNPPLTILQPRIGYRFTLDPLILAFHVHPAPGDRILDIGCGCGIMPLILAARYPDVRITGVEIQAPLADLAEKNAASNHMDRQIRVLHQDIRTVTGTDEHPPVEIIISNPPYKKRNSGRRNQDIGRAQARHEITLDITTLMGKAGSLLKPGGRLYLIFPADRSNELTSVLTASRFQSNWTRFVHFLPPDKAARILVCASTIGNDQSMVRPPLYLYHGDGTPTDAHLALLQL